MVLNFVIDTISYRIFYRMLYLSKIHQKISFELPDRETSNLHMRQEKRRSAVQ